MSVEYIKVFEVLEGNEWMDNALLNMINGSLCAKRMSRQSLTEMSGIHKEMEAIQKITEIEGIFNNNLYITEGNSSYGR